MVFKLRCREQDAENSRECVDAGWTKRDLNILTEHSKLKWKRHSRKRSKTIVVSTVSSIHVKEAKEANAESKEILAEVNNSSFWERSKPSRQDFMSSEFRFSLNGGETFSPESARKHVSTYADVPALALILTPRLCYSLNNMRSISKLLNGINHFI